MRKANWLRQLVRKIIGGNFRRIQRGKEGEKCHASLGGQLYVL
jgi:hypothetical protein